METIYSGIMHGRRGEIHEALAAYINALLLEPSFVPCKILIGAVLSSRGSKMLPVARTLLSDALRIEPTNRMAWYHLGLVHRDDGRIADAADCFQAASMLEESDPIESFSIMHGRRGEIHEALAAYINALLLEPSFVPCKILIGAVLSSRGSKMLPVARTLLSDALRIEPTNRMAWYHLGLVHRDDGRIADAADCFQAASMLEESDPIESFSSIL
ncbi:unnamed protein product [Ilex paraguariensis]|uniref:Uncharacterized protein n=1 Tax=Ilex paraguariensis TaxID=185542 RepID=A0ABC8THU7_9AQUA